MKYLILIILSINTALACQLSIPESYIPTFLAPPVVGAYQACEEKPGEACYCIQDVDPYLSELVPTEVIDHMAKEDEVACLDEADCDDKFSKLKCKKDFKPIKNYELKQVYCTKPVMRAGPKKLVTNAAKKAAREAEKLAEKNAKDTEKATKENAKAALKAIDLTKTKTTKELTDIIKLILDSRQE